MVQTGKQRAQKLSNLTVALRELEIAGRKEDSDDEGDCDKAPSEYLNELLAV